MKKTYLNLIILLLFVTCWTACQSNQQKMARVQDSLMALNSSDTSILIYVSGINKLKSSLSKKESPVYTKGDYAFYTSIYKKDSIPVLYEEYGELGANSYNEKKYFMENGSLVLYYEKSKLSSSNEEPNFEYKEVRIFFRNDVFLKAEERIAKSDSLLSQMAFTLIDQYLIDKNKQIDFSHLEDANNEAGDFNLTFDRIQNSASSKKYLIMANQNSNTYESSYQVLKADSLIIKLEENPDAFRGRKLKINYDKQGTRMVYNSAELGF